MPILPILEFPDPRLRTKATPVKNVNKSVQRLVDDLLETMYGAPGIGLAATQVNVHKRVLVIDVSQEKDKPLVFINPEIVRLEGEILEHEEGCLSVPGYYEDVERAEHIRLRYQDRNGEQIETEMEGLLAVCVQHEIDHLDGKLFVDYLSEAKRSRIRKRLVRDKRHRSDAVGVAL